MSFEQLGLRPELLANIARQGYTIPTPIQEKVIPAVLNGKDVLAGAQTGTGKTAAFVLPLLQLLHTKKCCNYSPSALILAPTRELALQIEDFIKKYGKNIDVSSTLVFGGVNIRPQISKLKQGTDIIVATPGRLLDHVGQRTVDLSKIEYLVLDEADRMLDMGFIHDIKRIIKLLPFKRQNLLFSATYSDEIRVLADSILKNPEIIEVAKRNAAAETVTQYFYPVQRNRKKDLLTHLIKTENLNQLLVFTRTKHGANRLTEQLQKDGFTASAIHGNKSQGARSKALSDFKSNRLKILVATDIASRGLDIQGLPHVVNYELPNVPEDYIHRIGRTGRAGLNGLAYSLVSSDEVSFMRSIERLLKCKAEIKEVPGFSTDSFSRESRSSDSNREYSGNNRNNNYRRKSNSPYRSDSNNRFYTKKRYA